MFLKIHKSARKKKHFQTFYNLNKWPEIGYLSRVVSSHASTSTKFSRSIERFLRWRVLLNTSLLNRVYLCLYPIEKFQNDTCSDSPEKRLVILRVTSVTFPSFWYFTGLCPFDRKGAYFFFPSKVKRKNNFSPLLYIINWVSQKLMDRYQQLAKWCYINLTNKKNVNTYS